MIATGNHEVLDSLRGAPPHGHLEPDRPEEIAIPLGPPGSELLVKFQLCIRIRKLLTQQRLLKFVYPYYNIKVGRGLAPAGQFVKEIVMAIGDNMCYFPLENPEIVVFSGGGTKAPPYNSIFRSPR